MRCLYAAEIQELKDDFSELRQELPGLIDKLLSSELWSEQERIAELELESTLVAYLWHKKFYQQETLLLASSKRELVKCPR
jgi:hypothetical protein